MNKQIICRFAPSPTGSSGMHIGNLRTALYSYLYAKQNNGKFILRIEDTDQFRSNEAAVKDIINIMSMFNLHYDEMYIQSERLLKYQYHAFQLVKMGMAYICNCPKDSEGVCNCKNNHQQIINQTNHCIKLNLSKCLENNDNVIVCKDEIRKNNIKFNILDLYDIVLLKSDGFPTYHLASVIDDHFMHVTDVFRGEEWISSFPYHVILYNTFKYELPKFYHLPLIVNNCGQKLSKRDGDFSVQHLIYQDEYIPSAILNYILLLGWHPPGNDEIFTLDEMIKIFDITRLRTSSCCYDSKKLRKLNFIHGKTEYGRNEFVKYNKIYDNYYDKLNIDILYDVYKTLGNIKNIMLPLQYSSECLSYIKEQYKFYKDLQLLIYEHIHNHSEYLTQEQSLNIILELKNTYKESIIHSSIRCILTGNIQGIPGNTLLCIHKIKDLLRYITGWCK